MLRPSVSKDPLQILLLPSISYLAHICMIFDLLVLIAVRAPQQALVELRARSGASFEPIDWALSAH